MHAKSYGFACFFYVKISKIKKMENYKISSKGYYGCFGGAYVPVEMRKNINSLAEAFEKIKSDPVFNNELHGLLKNYVGRPTPLYHAKNLSEKYQTTIFLKREDLCHTGAHKINNALGQILMAKYMGKSEIIAETGAGQHGVATATAAALMGMKCRIFMGLEDMKRQSMNVQRMTMLGAQVVPVTTGGAILSDAVDAALDYWVKNLNCFYLLGSAVGPHPYPAMVAHFQSVISKEIKAQIVEEYNITKPTYVVACVGGGSNAVGAFSEFIDDETVELICVEAAGMGVDSGLTAATLHIGVQREFHGSRSLVICDEMGEVKEPYSISAGLDYPGIGPLIASLVKGGRAEVYAASDEYALESAFELTRLEGIIPAIESAHAMAILKMRKFDKKEIVVINLSGRGDKDLETYLNFKKML